MLIKDQIRSRREALGVSLDELARRAGVTPQAIRHWEAGRSFPGKSKAPLLEQALSFVLDWTEGRNAPGGAQTAAALIDQGDIDILLVFARLPADAKEVFAKMMRLHLEAVDRGRGIEPTTRPIEPPDDEELPAAPPAPAPAATKKTRTTHA